MQKLRKFSKALLAMGMVGLFSLLPVPANDGEQELHWKDVLINEHLQALQKDPNNIASLLELGRLFSQRGQCESAVGHYQKVIKLARGQLRHSGGSAIAFTV